jgi:DNA-binding Lrp family transcriptional regulator
VAANGMRKLIEQPRAIDRFGPRLNFRKLDGAALLVVIAIEPKLAALRLD